LSNLPHELEQGAILAGKYLVGRVLGQGGFGITYIGWDIPANKKRAIKEYFPSDSVTRQGDRYTVMPHSSQGVPQLFAQGRDKFYSEAQNLARFDQAPDIVSVTDFFQENGTAYIVMEFIEGQTLKQYLNSLGRPLELADALALLAPVARSLEQVHTAGLIHRDVSPDNIMLTTDGTAKLLDFGAARGFSLQGARTNTVNVKMGYAPDEQYRTHGNQGPWTDVYALAATIYRAVTGVVPTQAIDRAPTDLLDKPTALGAHLTPAQEKVLLKGMAVYPEGRYKSIREFYDAMERSVQEEGKPSVSVDGLKDAFKGFTGKLSGGSGKTQGQSRTRGTLTDRMTAWMAAHPKEARRRMTLFLSLACVVGMLMMYIGAFESSTRYLANPTIQLYVPAALTLCCMAVYLVELILRFRNKKPQFELKTLKYAGFANAALSALMLFLCSPMEDFMVIDFIYLFVTCDTTFIAYRLLALERT